jgi:hypothetical protein
VAVADPSAAAALLVELAAAGQAAPALVELTVLLTQVEAAVETGMLVVLAVAGLLLSVP